MNENIELILERFGKEMERVNWYADWYEKHSKTAKLKYIIIRVLAISLSSAVPLLIAFQALYEIKFLTSLALISSALVALLSSLETFFRWGETYVDDKNAELALYSISRKYGAEYTKFMAKYSDNSIEKAEKLLDSLRKDYEAIVGSATGAFTKRAKEVATKIPSTPKART